LNVSCSRDTDDYPESGNGIVSLKLIHQSNFYSKLIDDDNLLSEQTVTNLSIFFTEPSSGLITAKYVYTGFSSFDDYKLVTLPLDPATLLTKDIYIIANHNDKAALEAVSTIDDIRAMITPLVNKNNNLAAEHGLCMYGNTLNFNFNSGSNTPAIVNMERTCAKMRINVTFPGNPTLSTDNTFLIENMATYTHVVKRDLLTLPQSAYYTHAAALPLTDNGSQKYVNTVYVYESNQIPVLHLYTNIGNSQQSYSANLPKPARNYLYDIDIMVYDDSASQGTRSAGVNKSSGYTYKSIVRVYNEKGERVD